MKQAQHRHCEVRWIADRGKLTGREMEITTSPDASVGELAMMW